MVPRKDKGDIGTCHFQGIDILEDGIGGSLVPLFADSLLGGDYVDVITHLVGEEIPSKLDVPVKGERLVLSEDYDVSQSRIGAIGECEIDDPVVGAEGDPRFCPVPGQRV